MKKPTKAIIPAAGLGTRFLPQTKAMPKEMLPIVDKPVIQIVVEELVASGVTEIIIVTGSQKRAIEDHFDRDEGLEQALKEKGKFEEAKKVQEIAELANIVYVRQKRKPGEPHGNALPIRNAMHLLGDEPFYVIYPDDFFLYDGKSSIEQLLESFQTTNKSTMQAIEVNESAVSRYGIIDPDGERNGNHLKVKGVVEKPNITDAPSRIASVSGYLLTPEILPIITNLQPGNGGEIGIADAVDQLAKQDDVYAVITEGTYHDAGNKLSYMEALVDAGLRDKEMSSEFEHYLRKRLS
jgi:UTP--glucose-1-phosphate uridylyltransferase